MARLQDAGGLKATALAIRNDPNYRDFARFRKTPSYTIIIPLMQALFMSVDDDTSDEDAEAMGFAELLGVFQTLTSSARRSVESVGVKPAKGMCARLRRRAMKSSGFSSSHEG